MGLNLSLFKDLVTPNPPLYTGAMSAYPYSTTLEGLYTFKSKFEETVCGAVREGNTLLVPRESVPYAEPANDFRVSFPPVAIDCKIEWRHEQQGLCEQSLAYLQQGRNHIFEAPTGHGKTVEGSWIAAKLGQPTLIVVTKEDLMTQWYDALTKVLCISPALVGRVQQDECDYEGKRFVLGMVHSLIIPDRYPPEMYKYFGLVEFDEVHLMAAECFIRACQMFPAKYRLGFSATPDRKDGKTKLLNWHIGPTLVVGKVVSMPPKVLIRKIGWKIPRKRVATADGWEYEPIPHAPGRMMLVIKAMAGSTERNMEIVNFAAQTYKAQRRVLVISDLIDHLERLFQLLAQEGVPGNQMGYYIGGKSKIELGLAKEKPVILGTYAMCSTGTDAPKWDSLVFATPRADVKQTIGRVLRAHEGKKKPVILDLVDNESILNSFHLSRLRQYYSVGAEIVRLN